MERKTALFELAQRGGFGFGVVFWIGLGGDGAVGAGPPILKDLVELGGFFGQGGGEVVTLARVGLEVVELEGAIFEKLVELPLALAHG